MMPANGLPGWPHRLASAVAHGRHAAAVFEINGVFVLDTRSNN